MVTESKTTGQYERMMERVFRVIEAVEQIETPRGYRLWMLIPTHDGGVVPVFVRVRSLMVWNRVTKEFDQADEAEAQGLVRTMAFMNADCATNKEM